jgi:hypothetical protein
MSAQNACVVTNVVTSFVEINKRGECYALFWLHCGQKTTHRILQLCGVLSNVRHKVRSLQRTYFLRSCGPSLAVLGVKHNVDNPTDSLREEKCWTK